jgi:hypothetical protein
MGVPSAQLSFPSAAKRPVSKAGCLPTGCSNKQQYDIDTNVGLLGDLSMPPMMAQAYPPQ